MTEGKIPRSVIEEKIRARQGGYFYTPTLWYNPNDNTIYSDNEERYNVERPNYEFPVMNVMDHKQARDQLLSGNPRTDMHGIQMAGLAPELYRPWDEYMYVTTDMKHNGHSLHESLDRNIQQGGMLTREDFTYMKTLQMQTNLVLPLTAQHILTNAVTVQRVSQFKFKWARVGENFDVVTRKMSELGVPYTAQPIFTVAEQELNRYGTHVASTWEFRAETFDVDILGTLTAFYRGKMDDERNRAIADIFNAKTVSALGGTWTAVSGTPEALADTIDSTNRGAAGVFVSNRKTYRAYHSSVPWTAATSADQAVQQLPYESSINYTGNAGKFFPGFTWIVDSMIGTGKIFALDKRAITFFDGPERTISYGMMQNEVEGTINKAYFSAIESDSVLFTGNSGATS
jgi:hypothetical protein